MNHAGLKARIAAHIGIAARRLLRVLGRAGSSLPGKIAIFIRQPVLFEWRSQFEGTVVLVAGTNGKTTTANYICSSLQLLSGPVIANRSGANLVSGIVSSTLDDLISHNATSSYAVFECDERALEEITSATRPDIIVLLNIFRDQLDRYGDLREVLNCISRALRMTPPETRIIANADDPNIVYACSKTSRKMVWVALSHPTADSPDRVLCPRCSSELSWTQKHWSCPNCFLKRPNPDLIGADLMLVSFESLRMKVNGLDLSLQQWGSGNAFNAVAAWAVLRLLGFHAAEVALVLSCAKGAYGRNERISIGHGSLTIHLVKNPVSFNQFVTHLKMQSLKPVVVIAVNNAAADGKDTSWIWDADFEGLLDAPMVVPSGSRAPIVANRLKYASVTCSAEPMSLKASLSFALQCTTVGKDVVFLCTYTAMLQARAFLKKNHIIND